MFNFTGQLPGFDSDQDGTSYNTGIVETHVFTPNVVNEFRLSYGRIGFTFGLPASTLANPLYNQPAVTVSSMTGYGIPGTSPRAASTTPTNCRTRSAGPTASTSSRSAPTSPTPRERSDSFNFYGTIGYANDTGFNPRWRRRSLKYTGLANLIDDFGGTGASVSQNFGSPIAQPRLFSQNYFVQDTYRPIPTLSLDLGFRYEYNGAPFNARALLTRHRPDESSLLPADSGHPLQHQAAGRRQPMGTARRHYLEPDALRTAQHRVPRRLRRLLRLRLHQHHRQHPGHRPNAASPDINGPTATTATGVHLV